MKDYCKPGEPKHFSAGDEIEAMWSHDRTMWYRASVTSENADGTYGVQYMDGRTDVGVKAKRMRHLKGFQEKAWVEARWMGGDSWYVAQVLQVNDDGTYNLNYPDDGITEDNVDKEMIRAAEDKVGPSKPTDGDAVCETKAAIGDASEIVEEAEADIDAFAEREEGGNKKVKEELAKLGPPQHAKGGDAAAGAAVAAGGGGAGPAGGGGAAAEAGAAKGHAAAAAAAPAPAAAAPAEKPGADKAAAGADHDHNEEKYARKGEEGGCLTEDNGKGTYTRKDATAKECEQACTGDPTCVAFELGPKNHCELHTEAVAQVGPKKGYQCFDKLAAPTTTAAPAATTTAVSPEMRAFADKIQMQRAEIVARTKELIARAKATGATGYELEQLEDLLAQDMARLKEGLPKTPEEMALEMAELDRVIADRAMRLDKQLEKEADLVSGKEKLPPPTKKDKEQLASKVQQKRAKLKDSLQKLEEKEARLKAEGKMDPELQAEIDRAKQVLSGALLDLDGVESAIMSGNSTAVRAIASSIGSKMKSAKTFLKGFGAAVVPHGVKWWRYRWEYSFAESNIICLLCLIAAFWQKVHDTLRMKLSQHVIDSTLFLSDELPNIALAAWTRHFWGEMCVLILTLMTLWMIARLGFFDPWMRFQYMITARQLNLPTDAETYVHLSRDIAFQLVAAVMLFFALTLKICYRAMQNDRDCRCLESSSWQDLQQTPVAANMIGRFAESPEEFAALKKGWLEGVAHRATPCTPRGARSEAQLVVMALEERRVLTDGNHNAFPLWCFISQRVRRGVVKTFSVNWMIWILCWLTFACFGFLHAVLNVAYIRISLSLAMISVLVFTYMIVSVHSMVGSSVNDDSLSVRLSPTSVVALFQFPLFFLCFCTVRLTVSVWMWTFFFGIALTFALLIAAFVVLFYMVISPMMVAYLIKTSFPPHTNGTSDLIRDVMNQAEVAKLRDSLRKTAPRAYAASPQTPPVTPLNSYRALVL